MALGLEVDGIGTGGVHPSASAAQDPQPHPAREAAPPPAKTANGDDDIRKMLALAVQKQDSQRVVLDYDKARNQSIVKVIDKTSGEVIRQFPPEEIVRMAEMMDQTSLLLDKKI